jgi:hypothetical protein
MKSISELNTELEKAVERKSALEEKINILKEKELLPELRREYCGKFFVYQNSSGTDRWPLYRKITDIQSVWFIKGDEYSVRAEVFEFEDYPSEYSDAHVFNVTRKTSFLLEIIGAPISEKAFYSAFDKMVQKVQSMRK